VTITRINNNIAAINATRNLNRTTFDLEKSLERLSSGLRINRASDDASGLTISEKLRSQIRGLNQALKNAEDAVSLVNTAEGALDETTSILQRIRELAVKAANTGGLDINAIQAAQDEIDSAIQEITRIGQDTQFSTRRLLNGGNAITASAATGYGVTVAQGPATTSLAEGTHYLQISQVSAGSLTVTAGSDGLNIGTGSSVANSTFDSGSYAISVSNVFADQNQTIVTQAWVTTGAGIPTGGVDLKTLDNFNGAPIATGDTITVTGTVADGTAFNFSYTVASGADTLATFITALETAINGAVASSGDDVTITLGADGALTIEESALNVGSQLAISSFSVAGNAVTSTATAAAAGSAVVSVGGGPAQTVAHNSTVTFYGPQPTNELDPTPEITITFATLTAGVDTLVAVQEQWSGSLDGGKAVTFQNGDQEVLFKNGSSAGYTSGEYALMNFGAALTAGTVQIAVQNNGLNFHVGANEWQNITVGIGDLRASNLGRLQNTGETVADINVKTVTGANLAIQIVDAAVEQVSRQRSYLGAITNRLEKTISNLGVSAENLTASESRIRDADIAYETTRFTRNQILLQAGTSILAQANIAPQSVLQLLGG